MPALTASGITLKRTVIVAAGLGLALSACNRPVDDAAGLHRRAADRYAGVGLYPADRMWKQLSVSPPNDAARARTVDDGYVIVVVDSHTGELRQCGNLSGRCIAMNPWSATLSSPQVAPVSLIRHADELDADVRSDGAKPAPDVRPR